MGLAKSALWQMLLLFAMIALLAQRIYADEDVTDPDEDEVQAPTGDDGPSGGLDSEDAADGLRIKATLPAGTDLLLGEWAEVLVGFQNGKQNPTYAIEFVRAFLVNPGDNANYWNFTGNRYNRTAEEGATATIKYRFRPDPMLEPRTYGLAVQVFYTDEDNRTMAAIAYNETIVLLDNSSAFDARSIFTYILSIALLAGGGYYTKSAFFSKKRGPRASAQAKENTTAENVTGTGDSSFLPQSYRATLARSKSPGSKSPASK